MRTIILITVSVSLLILAQATLEIHRVIPKQEVTSNQKIKWLGSIPDLRGFYNVKLVIFPRRAAHHGRIMLSVYKNDRQITSYTATRKRLSHTLRLFEIDKDIKINSGEHLEIHYEGSSPVWVREKPGSFIILTLLGNDRVSTAQL